MVNENNIKTLLSKMTNNVKSNIKEIKNKIDNIMENLTEDDILNAQINLESKKRKK